MDDMLLFGTNINVINEIKKVLSYCFEMKDLDKVDVIFWVYKSLNIKTVSLCLNQETIKKIQ